MLSYQHSFHAGNRADVIKHACLHLTLRLMRRGQGEIRYLETHAGRGLYDLHCAAAQKNREYETGIAVALSAKGVGPDLGAYLACVRRFSPTRAPRWYPGSPVIAAGLLASHDRIDLAELHPQEHAALQDTFKHDPRVRIAKADGFELAGKLRPRAGVRTALLIDPSYELKTDYLAVVDLAERVRSADPRAVILIWYPVMADGREGVLLRRAESRLPEAAMLQAVWATPDPKARALVGAGLLAVGLPRQHVRRLRALSDTVGRVFAPPAGAPASKPED
jgi:23S rRNA (adenine2030-N6)-methyltransferase